MDYVYGREWTIAYSQMTLNENQITLLQSTLETLHNIKDWEMLTETIIREAVTLLGGGKGEFFVFDMV